MGITQMKIGVTVVGFVLIFVSERDWCQVFHYYIWPETYFPFHTQLFSSGIFC